MKAIRLILALVILVPAFALLGAMGAYNNQERSLRLGLSIGAIVGVFFGLTLGGVGGR